MPLLTRRAGRRLVTVLALALTPLLGATAVSAHVPVEIDADDWNPLVAPHQVNKVGLPIDPADGLPYSGGQIGYLHSGDAPGRHSVRSVQLDFNEGDEIFLSLLIPAADPESGAAETPERLAAYDQQPHVVLVSPRKADGSYQVEVMDTYQPEAYPEEDAWIHEFCEGFHSNIQYQRLGSIGLRPTENLDPDPGESLAGFMGDEDVVAEVTGTYTLFVYSGNRGWKAKKPDASPGRFALSVGIAELPRGTVVEGRYLERATRMSSPDLFAWYERTHDRTCTGAPPGGN